MADSKIFGIGLSKTGTTSLTRALRVLDIPTTHFPFHTLDFSQEPPALQFHKLTKPAYTDTPIPRFYKDLDREFPGSKFILTVRNLESWLRSCEKNHIWPGDFVHDKAIRGQAHIRALLSLHHDLYGSVWFDREIFQRHYEKHREDVMEYFKDRPGDLLVMDICAGDGWEQLCEFVGKTVPKTEFPRANVGAEKFWKRTTRRWFWLAVERLHFGLKAPAKYLPRLQQALRDNQQARADKKRALDAAQVETAAGAISAPEK